jgi:hypothetical protein
VLEPTLAGSPDAGPYAVIAVPLGTTEGTVRVAARQPCRGSRERVSSEIAATVSVRRPGSVRPGRGEIGTGPRELPRHFP